MLDILLDSGGDLKVSETGDISLTESVRQAIRIRLQWFLGEWRLGPLAGLEDLRKFDAEVDSSSVRLEDYEAQKIVDSLLFPGAAMEKEKEAARHRDYYEAHREESLALSHAYYEAHKEEIAARKRRWYQENKARVAVQQKAYRESVGLRRTDEERDAARASAVERNRLRARERYWQSKGMTLEEADVKKAATEQLSDGKRLEKKMRRSYDKAYYAAHKEEIKAKNRARYQRKKEQERQMAEQAVTAAA